MAFRTLSIRSRRQALLLGTAWCLVLAIEPQAAVARSLVPQAPSVEVNLDVLQGLQAPVPTVTPIAPPPAPSKRKTPREQPPVVNSAPATLVPVAPMIAPLPLAPVGNPLPYAPRIPVEQLRKTPIDQPVVDADMPPKPEAALKPHRERKHKEKPAVPVEKAAPEKEAPAPSLPETLPPVTMPTLAPLPPEKPLVKAPAVKPPAVPAPAPVLPALAPVEKPVEKPAEKVAPKPVAKPAPAEKAPAEKLPPALPPLTLPKPETAAPLPPLPAPAKAPAATEVPVNVAKPKPAPALPSVPPPALAPAAAAKPAIAGPDISGLDFSKLPAEAPTKPAAAPVPAAKPVAAPTKPAPVFVPSPTPSSAAPEIAPLTKQPPALPPTVQKRLNTMNPPEPVKQGIVSDKTHVDNPLEKLPPAELPKPAAPDSKHTPVGNPIDLQKTPNLPAPQQETPAPAVTPPKLPTPEAPPVKPELPKLPMPEAPQPLPPKLPSLTPLTGDQAPTTHDALQPKEGVESKPLPPVPATPVPAASKEKTSLPPLPVLTETPASAPVKPTPSKPEAVKPPAPAKPEPAPAPKPAAADTTKDTTVAKPTPSAPPVVAPPLNPTAAEKLTRTVSFEKDKIDLSDSAKTDLAAIADKVKQSEGTVRIVAYAAGTPEQASVAKRISLSRALQVRAELIKKGVNSLNINVQALGNQVPSGDADRADVFVK